MKAQQLKTLKEVFFWEKVGDKEDWMLQVLLRLRYNTAVFTKKLNKPKDIKYWCNRVIKIQLITKF